MSHLALYRMFRPQTFDQIKGQEHITTTLKNQIKTGQIGHAYLFCGTRGTGKTTAAKVFAKAINCQNSQDGNPCLECQNCTKQSDADIYELDAASNNGVDYMRDIKEKVSYAPVNGKYKVYIIDEVHMLSSSAFNAFLKTLEEPPAHAVFILCTTEPQKILQTILSRCLRFDFKLVGLDELNALVKNIFDKINVKATEEAINAISTAGEGSVRDALSIADRCVSFVGDKELTYDDVLTILGAVDMGTVQELAECIINGDVGNILKIIYKVTQEGKSIAVLCRDLSVAFKNMLVAATIQDANSLLKLPLERYQRLKQAAQSTTQKKLMYALDVFSHNDNALRFALNPTVLFESLALKVALSTGQVDTDGLDMRITRLEKKLEQLTSAISNGELNISNTADLKTVVPNNQGQIQQTPQNVQNSLSNGNTSNSDQTPPKSVLKDIKSAESVWGNVLTTMRHRGETLLLTACEKVEKVWIEDNTTLVLTANQGCLALLSKKDNAETLQSLVNEFSNFVVKLSPLDTKDSWEEIMRQFRNLAGEAPLTVDNKPAK